jgi:uncharacterized protein YjdB
MSISKKISRIFLMSFLFAVAIFTFKEYKAMASTVTMPEYHFVINGKKPDNEFEMKSADLGISVEAEGWAQPATVQWISSEPGVITLEDPSIAPTYRRMVRRGPGFSTITAIINSGGYTYTISFLVKVSLQINVQETKLVTATTTGERILSLDEIGDTRQIYLKYVDYENSSGVTVSGGAISATAVDYESDNEGVATVSESGVVKAVGSGSCNIKITSRTMSSKDMPMSVNLRVVVRPRFTMTLISATGSSIVHNSQESQNTTAFVDKVPVNFKLESNASVAQNLTWVVYDCSTTPKKKLSADSAKLKYEISDLSGNVSFTNVKAGTYEIYAFANSEYTVATNAPYAYMKIIVPIALDDISLVMQVGDTYDIFANSNIPSINTFHYTSADGNIARVDQTTSVITARKKGTVTITCSLNESLNLFSEDIGDIIITVKVIDGISLSATSALIYTKGTLLLTANVTDTTRPITWTSSDTSIATVTDGLVTGVKAGTAVITAKQTIDGVVKKASCTITVQQSVSKITVDPAKVTIGINDYKTLHANVSPNGLANVVLQWKSSDESIVKVTEASPLTVTVQGVSGGHAVISAINQDNVVVGYSHISVQQPVTGITLSETDITVPLSSNRIQLRATVSPDNAINKEVSWKSTDSSKASVDSNGLITLKKTGTVSIIATSKDNPSVTAICNINILIPVTSVSLDETTKTLYVGQSARLGYVLLPSNASTNTVTWTSSNTKVATVDNTGYVTAKAVGTTVIMLKAIDGNHTAYCTLTVKRSATGVKLDVSTLKLTAGEAYVLKPTFTPADSTDTTVYWESSDTKVAIVDSNGKITAKATGSTIIMAKLESGATAYVKVTVSQPVKGLIMNFTDKTIYVGEEFELKVSLTPSTATELGVTWQSSNTKIATVSDKGIVKGIAGGTAIITCTTVDGGYTVNCVVTVREAVSTISLNYQSYYLGIDKTVTLVATVTTPTATNQNVFWSSSNPDVASVNQKGKVTGRKLGYATITATALDGSEVEASCEIRVVNPVESVTLDYSTISLMVGQSKKLKATVKPKKATLTAVKWTTSDPNSVIVDESGQVIALKAGNATITAEAIDNSGRKAICYVTVYDRVPATGITLQDKKIVMVPGEEKIVQMAMIPASSNDQVTWSTDNAAIAKVDKKTGRITARATGVAYVTAMTDSGKTATVEVTVIGLNITDLTLEQYTTYPYRLEVEGASGPVSWSIDNPQVAEITNGIVSSRGVGTATISAKVNGRKLICKLKVVKIGQGK